MWVRTDIIATSGREGNRFHIFKLTYHLVMRKLVFLLQYTMQAVGAKSLKVRKAAHLLNADCDIDVHPYNLDSPPANLLIANEAVRRPPAGKMMFNQDSL